MWKVEEVVDGAPVSFLPPKTSCLPLKRQRPSRPSFAQASEGRRQFKLSGRRKSGYHLKFIRAVAQPGSALPWGGRGPGLAPSNLPLPIRVSRSATDWLPAYAGEFKSRGGSLRGCASTQANPPGGDPAKRKGGCVGRNIPAAVQAFGPPQKRVPFEVHSGRSAAW
jgi:hypothetical protein